MPKTAEQERLEGYPGHRKVNDSAPKPNRDIPDPPKWMKSVSTRAYHDIVRLVGSDGMRVMGRSDKFALIMLCEAFEEWRNCRDILAKDGRYFESGKVVFDDEGNQHIDNRQIKRHPAVGDMQNAWNRIMMGLGKFGMTPYDRQKVVVLLDDKPKEKTREEILKEKRAKALELVKKKTVNG